MNTPHRLNIGQTHGLPSSSTSSPGGHPTTTGGLSTGDSGGHPNATSRPSRKRKRSVKRITYDEWYKYTCDFLDGLVAEHGAVAELMEAISDVHDAAVGLESQDEALKDIASDEEFPEDLTKEGIEPNPGPVARTGPTDEENERKYDDPSDSPSPTRRPMPRPVDPELLRLFSDNEEPHSEVRSDSDSESSFLGSTATRLISVVSGAGVNVSLPGYPILSAEMDAERQERTMRYREERDREVAERNVHVEKSKRREAAVRKKKVATDNYLSAMAKYYKAGNVLPAPTDPAEAKHDTSIEASQQAAASQAAEDLTPDVERKVKQEDAKPAEKQEASAADKVAKELRDNESIVDLQRSQMLVRLSKPVVGQYGNVIEGALQRDMLCVYDSFFGPTMLEEFEVKWYAPWTYNKNRTGKWFNRTFQVGKLRFLLGKEMEFLCPVSVMEQLVASFHNMLHSAKPTPAEEALDVVRALCNRACSNLNMDRKMLLHVKLTAPLHALWICTSEEFTRKEVWTRKVKATVSGWFTTEKRTSSPSFPVHRYRGPLRGWELARTATAARKRPMDSTPDAPPAEDDPGPDPKNDPPASESLAELTPALPPAAAHPVRDLTEQGIEPNPGPSRVFMADLAPLIEKLQRKGASASEPTDKTDWETIRTKQILHGFGSGDWRPLVYAANGHNEMSAVKARVTSATLPVNVAAMRKFRAFVWRMLPLLFPGGRHAISSLDFEVWFAGVGSSTAVKAKIRDAHDRLTALGIDEDTVLGKGLCQKFTVRKGFPKVENLTLRTPNGVERKAARLISDVQHKEFVCLVGPFVASLQNYVKSKWDANSPICFTSGVRADRVAGVIASCKEMGWHILEDDVSAFDASIGEDLCHMEPLIMQWFGAKRATVDLLTANVATRGYTSKGIRYKVPGTRKSGDPHTSLFNTFWNVMIHLYAFSVARPDIPYHQLTEHIHMVAQGDDNVLCHDGQRFVWRRVLADLGFECEANYRDHLWQVEFCSCIFLPVEGGYTFCPKPGRLLSKNGYFVNPPDATAEQLVRGNCLGLENQCSACPPISAYLATLLKKTEGVKPVEARGVEWKMTSLSHRPTAETHAMLYERYGWHSGLQYAMERQLSTLQLGEDWNSPVAELLYDIDTSGPRVVRTHRPQDCPYLEDDLRDIDIEPPQLMGVKQEELPAEGTNLQSTYQGRGATGGARHPDHKEFLNSYASPPSEGIMSKISSKSGTPDRSLPTGTQSMAQPSSHTAQTHHVGDWPESEEARIGRLDQHGPAHAPTFKYAVIQGGTARFAEPADTKSVARANAARLVDELNERLRRPGSAETASSMPRLSQAQEQQHGSPAQGIRIAVERGYIDLNPNNEYYITDGKFYEKKDDGWVRELTAEGIEPNPGPFVHAVDPDWQPAKRSGRYDKKMNHSRRAYPTLGSFPITFVVPPRRAHGKDLTKEGIEPNPGPGGLQDIVESAAFKYHGNYGGPNYSGGKFGSEANFRARPTDVLDSLFQEHDAYYANGKQAQGDRVLCSKLGTVLSWDNAHKVIPAALGFELKQMLGLSKDARRFDPDHNSKMHALNGNVKKTLAKIKAGGKPLMPALKADVKEAIRHAMPKPVHKAPREAFNMVAAAGAMPKLHTHPTVTRSTRGTKTIVRVNHSEVLGPVTVLTATAGESVWSADVDLFRPTSALSNYAGMFTNYRVKSLSYEYVPAVGTGTVGSYVAAFSTDPDDAFLAAGSYSSAISLATRDGAIDFQVYQRKTIHMPKNSKMLYVPGSSHTATSDERFEIVGQFTMIALVSAPAGTIGTMFVHYDLEFENEQVLRTPTFSLSGTFDPSGISPSLSTVGTDLVAFTQGKYASLITTTNPPKQDPFGYGLEFCRTTAAGYIYGAMLYPPGAYAITTYYQSASTMASTPSASNLVVVVHVAYNAYNDIVGTTYGGARYDKTVNQSSSTTSVTTDGFRESGILTVSSSSTYVDSTGRKRKGAVVTFDRRYATSNLTNAFVNITSLSITNWAGFAVAPPILSSETSSLEAALVRERQLIGRLKAAGAGSDTDEPPSCPPTPDDMTRSIHLTKEDVMRMASLSMQPLGR